MPFSRDRFRTTSNVLDDCLAAAVIEKLSEKELRSMDAQKTQRQQSLITHSEESV